MKFLHVLAIAAFVSFISLAFAQDLGTAGYGLLAKYLAESVFGVAGIILMIALILAATVYSLGAALGSDKMKSWGKIELFEVIYSAVILAMLSFVIISFDNVVQFASGSVFSDPIALKICQNGVDMPIYKDVPFCHIRLSLYFLNALFNELNQMAYKIYQSYLVTSTIGELAINLELVTEMAGFFTFNPFKGFVAVGNIVMSETFDYIMRLMLLNKFQEIFVAFISNSLFPVLLALGVTLRSFSFTRRLGGLLMALAIALFFIFPMFYVLGAFILDSIKIQAYDACAADSTCDHSISIEDSTISGNLYIGGKLPTLSGQDRDLGAESQAAANSLKSVTERKRVLTDPIDPGARLTPTDRTTPQGESQLTAMFGKALAYVKKLAQKDLRNKFASRSFENGGVIDGVARLSLFSLFFSLFGIMGTIAAIRSLSITFGGDIEIAGLTHLI